jgi:hypothetical protein
MFNKLDQIRNKKRVAEGELAKFKDEQDGVAKKLNFGDSPSEAVKNIGKKIQEDSFTPDSVKKIINSNANKDADDGPPSLKEIDNTKSSVDGDGDLTTFSTTLLKRIQSSLSSRKISKNKQPSLYKKLKVDAQNIFIKKLGPNVKSVDVSKKVFKNTMEAVINAKPKTDDNSDSDDDVEAKKGQGLSKKKPRHKLTMSEDGQFGSLQINVPKFKQMILHAKRGRKLVAKGPLSPDLHDLLTKKFNSRRNYSQTAINEYRQLAKLAGIEPTVSTTNGKAKLLQGRIGNPKTEKKNTSSSTVVTKYIHKVYTNPDELLERYAVLKGSISSGNASPEVRSEAGQLLDKLKDMEVISQEEFIRLQQQLMRK